MAGTLKKTTGRHEEVCYYEVADAYELMSVFTEHNEKPGAKTVDHKYTVDKTKTKSIGSYEWEMGFTGDMIKSDVVMKDIIAIGRTLQTGSDCMRKLCMVSMDEAATGDESGKKFYARELLVSVAVDEFSDNDGEMQASGTYYAASDLTEGTFDISTKTFTAAA